MTILRSPTLFYKNFSVKTKKVLLVKGKPFPFIQVTHLVIFRMPVVHTQTATCPENSGLSDATVRVIMHPNISESRITQATEIINLIPENDFENFAFDILSDPTTWTLTSIAQTPFGRRLRHYSRNHFVISDITCTHTIKQPHALLLTIELAFQNVKYLQSFQNDNLGQSVRSHPKPIFPLYRLEDRRHFPVIAFSFFRSEIHKNQKICVNDVQK